MQLNKLTLSVALLTAAGIANAEVNLRDYKEATSAYEDAYVNAKLNIQDGNQDQASYSADVKVDYARVVSTPDSNTTVKFSGDTSRNRGSDDNSKAKNNYNGLGSVVYDGYINPQESDLFWYGGGEVRIKKGADDPFTKLSGGVGYGRVVNATPMAKTNRLIAALVERGLIDGAPSADVHHKIANIIDREMEYRSKFGAADYKQSWIQDIEAALGVELDARGIIKVYDVLNYERISTRKYGWLVRAGVGVVITDFDGEKGKPLLEAVAEYHNPVSNSAQFSNITTFETVLDDDNDSYNLSNDMSYSYELSDRIDWLNSWKLSYVNNSAKGLDDPIVNTFSSTYRYYVSNSITADVTASAIKTNIKGSDVDTSLTMSLNYRLK